MEYTKKDLFDLSLPLDGILSMVSFGSGFEIIVYLELCVLLQKSD